MDIIHKRLFELVGTKHGASKALASALGISPNNITNWKAGRSDAYKKYLPQIADYYGVSLDWLSGRSEQKERPTTVSDDGRKEKSTPISEDGLSDDIKFLLSMYHSVPTEKKAEALAKIANDLKKAGLIE